MIILERKYKLYEQQLTIREIQSVRLLQRGDSNFTLFMVCIFSDFLCLVQLCTSGKIHFTRYSSAYQGAY